MKAEERRTLILQTLLKEEKPMSASSLASKLGVSRQIIVGDIALLRAGGQNILATPRGYLLQSQGEDQCIRRIACCHTDQQMEEELKICVDEGCMVMDVIVEHPVYGQLTGELELSSRYDISQFIEKVKQQSAHALSELTNGIHLHTLRCPNEQAYQRVCSRLKEAGILIPE